MLFTIVAEARPLPYGDFESVFQQLVGILGSQVLYLHRTAQYFPEL